jgi:hypothetical protein
LKLAEEPPLGRGETNEEDNGMDDLELFEEEFRADMSDLFIGTMGDAREVEREAGGRREMDRRIHTRRAIEHAYGEGVGLDSVRARRYNEDRTALARHKDSTTGDRVPHVDGDPSGRWMTANDPARTPDGVFDLAHAALEAAGLSLEGARQAFAKKAGRPTQARAELRFRVAAALLPLWEGDVVRHDHLADALGTPPQTLSDLMIAAERFQIRPPEDANPERVPRVRGLPLCDPDELGLFEPAAGAIFAAPIERGFS